MKQRILASSTAIVQLLMSLVPTALAVKVDVKKNSPQLRLLLQQQLMIHLVKAPIIIFFTQQFKENIFLKYNSVFKKYSRLVNYIV
jgi:glucan phosphoethanolaminetransferase (alkaline phosphatase superfamily)